MKKEVEKILGKAVDVASEEIKKRKENYTYKEVLKISMKSYIKGKIESQEIIDTLVEIIEEGI